MVNPLTPMRDQDRISPYNTKTISIRWVLRIEKNINLWIINWSNTKFLELTLKNCMVYSKENYRFDHFLSSRYRSTLVRMVVGGFLPFRFVCLFACLFARICVVILLALYSLKSKCIFSILFSTCFLSCWPGELVK